MLSISHLSVQRHGRSLFSPLSLSLKPGQGLWLQGANGSGKSSLLSALAGLLPVSGGKISWSDQPITAIHDDYCKAMHYVGHELLLDPQLTIVENITLDLRCDACSFEEIKQGMKEWELPLDSDRHVAELSAGQKQRVALLRLELAKASLWLLDEPLVALDKSSQAILIAKCQAHLLAGGLLIISSHQALGELSSQLSVYRLDVEVQDD